jgi:putative flippase GtrA
LILESEQRADTQSNDTKETQPRLNRWRSSLSQAAKLATGGAIGFLDIELVLTLGIYLLYHGFSVPQNAFSSPAFLALNAIAFVIGVSVAFFVNESLLIWNEGPKVKNHQRSILASFAKFQFLFLGGNIAMVCIQLVLLREFAFPPIAGNAVGAVVSFPISYFFIMHFDWRSNEIPHEQIPSQSSKQSRPKTFPQLPVKNLIETITQRISAHSSYNTSIQEYRLDVTPNRENETEIDFSLRMEVDKEAPDHKY